MFKRFVIFLVITALALGTAIVAAPSPAIAAAAAQNCKIVHYVKAADTLNKLTAKYNIDLTYFVKFNQIYKDAPNHNQRRSIYIGQRTCIPAGAPTWNGKNPTWADWPAADYTARLVGKNIVITTSWFNFPTTYHVKINNVKIGLMKVKTPITTKSLEVPKNLQSAKTVCIKSLTTDALVCRPINR